VEVEVDEVAFEIVARSGQDQGQNNNNKLKSSLFALAHIQIRHRVLALYLVLIMRCASSELLVTNMRTISDSR